MSYQSSFKNLNVLVTGHTGFKGSWLSVWLKKLGANVIGYSLEPNTNPSHFHSLKMDIKSIIGDIRDLDKLNKVFKEFKPDVVFHLAAQPLVRYSYNNPIETYETNVMGTLKVFEAARLSGHVKTIINVTSDKCYENKEWPWSYREIDPMGGFDPYSSSKGCSEILTSSYRNSYFSNDSFSKNHNTLLASARAGNVIGGGDWSESRLIPDAVRALEKNQSLIIRSPHAIRPWQHVLEPLRGYLTLASRLLEKDVEFASSWNFGPLETNCITVESLLNKMKVQWQELNFSIEKSDLHEATFLKLDSSKSKQLLNFTPKLSIEESLKLTAQWYKEFYSTGKLLTDQQIDWYMNYCSE
jgi:CDP-glucose 4,6-dehydratase